MTTIELPSGTAKVPPLYPGKPIVGSLDELRRSALETFSRVREHCGDVGRVRALRRELTVVASAAGVEHVLVLNAKNYRKDSPGYTELRRLLGDGLVTSEGPLWLQQRRFMAPAFHRERIASFAASMARCVGDMLDAWQPRLGTGEVFDVHREMMAVTWRIVGETLLSVDVRAAAQGVGDALEEVLENARLRMTSPVRPPPWLPTARNRRAHAAKGVLDEVVDRIIRARRAARGAPDAAASQDLLAMLMEATDEETGGHMSDGQLRDEVLTLMGAGHETTSNALTWALWLLGQHPEIEERMRGEIDDVTGGRAPALEDLPKLKLTERVVAETLRVCPPVWGVVRRAIEDDVVDGFAIPAGAFLVISQWVTHKHPAYWQNPETFDPDRFLDDDKPSTTRRPRYAYFPFLGGPRKCIGDTFALMETRLLLASIVQRAHLTLDPTHVVHMTPSITLRPTTGVRVRASSPTLRAEHRQG